jgi:hypothetical protein
MRRFLLLCVVLVCASGLAQAPESARVGRVGDAVVFDGRIDARSAAKFVELAQEPGVTRLVITSNGGLVAPALDMGDAVHAHRLDVEVPDACLSSCANYVFLAGRRKVLGRPDAVGWHGNMAHVLWLAQTGQGSWSAGAMAQARELARREADFYARIGVDGFVCWFGKIPPYDVDDFYALSPADMERFGIRDVTVRSAAKDAGPRPDVQMLQVDPATLQQDRPVVQLGSSITTAQPQALPALASPPTSGRAPGPPRGAGAAAARD